MPRKIFANAHAYHINSISLNTDGETYISADDLRINLWNLETSDQSFSTPPLSSTVRLIALIHPNSTVVLAHLLQTLLISSQQTWRSSLK